MPTWKTYDQEHLLRLTHRRAGETKIGELVTAGESGWQDAPVVILGIPEDIGVRANYGTGGAATAWPAFLKAFLNIQSTQAFSGANCCVYGHLDCSDLNPIKNTGTTADLRAAVKLIDEEVEKFIYETTKGGKLPVVIGGGHNNAYPIIRGAAKGFHRHGRISEACINTINLDAHSDFRPAEGRHSGNGFRYAFREEVLDRYAMIGLHRNYNAQSVLDDMARETRVHYSFWEEIFLEERFTFDEAVKNAIEFTETRICGLELDLDAVERVLSSATSPCGISPTLARRYLFLVAKHADLAYVHLCEGAVNLDNGAVDFLTGKLMAYLVSDLLSTLDISGSHFNNHLNLR